MTAKVAGPAILLLATMLGSAPVVAQLAPRCAACHLSDGAGVPGAFPSLQSEPARLATKPDGRRYLVLAIARGLSGPILAGPHTFRGVMPGNAAMTDAEIATTLNALTARAQVQVQPFTAAEVGMLRASGESLNSAAVAQLRAAIK